MMPHGLLERGQALPELRTAEIELRGHNGPIRCGLTIQSGMVTGNPRRAGVPSCLFRRAVSGI